MVFSHYAVAYLDILGFSEFVKEAEDNSRPEKLIALKKLFEEVIPREISIDGKNASYPDNMELRCLSFSDSIVVSAPLEVKGSYPALIAVSIKAIQISHSLLDMGLLVRGGIAVGNAYQTNSNILGTGYQEAVKMDKGAPQITLAESAEKELGNLIKCGRPRYSIFARNEQGNIILNSIHPEPTYMPDKSGTVAEYYKKYREIIFGNLNKLNSQEHSQAKDKWIWFARLFNANIKYFSLSSIPIDDELLTVSINYLNPPDTEGSSTSFDWMKHFTAPDMKIQFNSTK